MTTKFTEGDERTETFTITDQERYNRTISVSNTTYITAHKPTPTSPTIPGNGNIPNLEIPVVVSKGGTGAITSSSALFNLGIDVSNKQDGAVLAYKTSSGNFEATNKPINLSVEGGFF